MPRPRTGADSPREAKPLAEAERHRRIVRPCPVPSVEEPQLLDPSERSGLNFAQARCESDEG
jgi:hypothetical protein